jgi:hypothetical protein
MFPKLISGTSLLFFVIYCIKELVIYLRRILMEEKIYNHSPELQEMAEKIVEKYYFYLGHIVLENIYFAEIDSPKPKRAEAMSVSGVSSTWVKQIMDEMNKKIKDKTSFDNKLYCISVYGEEWDDISPTMQEWMVFDALLRIDLEGTGKLRKPDICDHGILLDYFGQIGIGPYWRKSSNLPSLLAGDALPIPLPPDNTDEGNSFNL